MKRVALLLLVFSIYYFSNTPDLRVAEPKTWVNEPHYEESVNGLSFVKTLQSTFYTPYSREELLYRDFILHKVSHVVFYGFLSYLILINLAKVRCRYLLAWLFTTLFAFTDEIHQYFVVGRSGRLYDVILDSSAAFITLFFLFSFSKIRKNQIEKAYLEIHKKEQKQG